MQMRRAWGLALCMVPAATLQARAAQVPLPAPPAHLLVPQKGCAGAAACPTCLRLPPHQPPTHTHTRTHLLVPPPLFPPRPARSPHLLQPPPSAETCWWPRRGPQSCWARWPSSPAPRHDVSGAGWTRLLRLFGARTWASSTHAVRTHTHTYTHTYTSRTRTHMRTHTHTHSHTHTHTLPHTLPGASLRCATRVTVRIIPYDRVSEYLGANLLAKHQIRQVGGVERPRGEAREEGCAPQHAGHGCVMVRLGARCVHAAGLAWWPLLHAPWCLLHAPWCDRLPSSCTLVCHAALSRAPNTARPRTLLPSCRLTTTSPTCAHAHTHMHAYAHTHTHTCTHTHTNTQAHTQTSTHDRARSLWLGCPPQGEDLEEGVRDHGRRGTGQAQPRPARPGAACRCWR